MKVLLDPFLFSLARNAGLSRARRADRDKQARASESYWSSLTQRDSVNRHTQGAIAEIGFALASGHLKDWLKAYDQESGPHGSKPDVGPVQVKGCGRGLNLLVHKAYDCPVTLVWCEPHLPEAQLVGWLPGDEVSVNEFWDELMPHPCWRVPWGRLRPIDSLIDECRRLGWPWTSSDASDASRTIG